MALSRIFSLTVVACSLFYSFTRTIDTTNEVGKIFRENRVQYFSWF